jgi:uncharacterized protein involved in response to NO
MSVIRDAGKPSAADAAARELALQKLVTAFICTGLALLLLPGTFLGVWNLVAISSHRAAHSMSPAWIQAHGQAQMFGWIGTFVIGIGFYSLSKMGRLMPFAVSRAWQSWALWAPGVVLHWISGVYAWHWRLLLPLSALLMLGGFLTFFLTVRQHRPQRSPVPVLQRPEMWMRLVLASSLAFLASLLLNLCGAMYVAFSAAGPALPPALDGRLLLISAWGFLVLSVWGFNARWLPVFAGLRRPNDRGLKAALGTLLTALAAGLAGAAVLCAVLLIAASVLASWSLHVFQPGIQPPKVQGIHRSFPVFVRLAYVWLLTAAVLTLCASLFDRNGGITGASRHALTVGFIGTMVFAIGPRVLPAFCGMRVLFSPRLMFCSLTLLNLGCLLRVVCEIPAYEMNQAFAWTVLPISAIAELTAVSLFVINLLATFARPPAHMAAQKAAA